MKKEFRMANANVGDKPQIEESDEDEDADALIGGESARKQRRKLKKMMQRGRERDDLYGSSSVSYDQTEIDSY
jgi:transcription initiation factor TFIIF subunit alpha